MFLGKNHHEAYWNSYRLLESQLLRLSHSICFDDTQINVYSSELADIINSACIKIESLAKDIYEDHIWPFQEDADVVPPSFTGKSFKPEKWTREKWKFDYNCLVEIDCKYALSKKQIQLKSEKFHFHKYGSTIIPFGRVSSSDTLGGYWEHSDRDTWHTDLHKIQAVDWLKSYQEIKHNYIRSISEHGTVKNAIMALAAFYLLTVFHSCLPSRQFDIEDRGGQHYLDFGSELFSCGMCNYTIPPCVIDSRRLKQEAEHNARVSANSQDIFKEQDLLNDTEGLPFLITLSNDVYKEVCSMVAQYCNPRNLDHFDVAPYRNNANLDMADAGAILYINLRKYIFAPYNKNRICIAFNVGTDHIYDSLGIGGFDYEKTKHKNKTATVLSALKIGDIVDATFVFEEEIFKGEVIKLDDHCIDLAVDENGTRHIVSQPKANIIFIRKVQN